MRTSKLPGHPNLPVVVTPDGDPSLAALLRIPPTEPAELDRHMREVGAVLFRGFEVRTPEDFQSFASLVTEKFVDYSRGTSPRKRVNGQVYTSTEAPPRIPIALHCELAYVNHYPDRVLFFCETEPEHRGETPICDMEAVYRAIPERIRDQFEAKGIRIIQNVLDKPRLGRRRTWHDMFNTDDRQHVESYCRTEEIECRWKPDGTLQLINHRPAILVHPVSGKKIWFNSAHNFHDSWSWEFRHFKLRGLSLLQRLAERFRRRRVNPDDFPIHCQYGDGTEIATEDMALIRQILWDHAVVYPWKKGDVILLDNLWVAHARMPYRGKRRILVAMGQSRATAPMAASA
jgi:alpha-ketoglutarate-dependent taurine dioxygenase